MDNLWLARYAQPLTKLLGQSKADAPEMTYRMACEMLETYYLNNDLYRQVMFALQTEGIWHESMKELRNPTYAAVEFYAMTLWSGQLPEALPIEADNEKIIEPIHAIWKWSNWQQRKQTAVRQFAMCGDMFIRIGVKMDDGGSIHRVFLQVVRSKNVTDFDTDEQGNVIWLRYDAPMTKRNEDGTESAFTHTEIWDPEQVRMWEHDGPLDVDIDTLPDPDEAQSITMAKLGIDFVPWVAAPFRDIGDKNGLPLIWPVLSKIDEANREVTRLAEMMFRHNKPLWVASANQLDAQGRPMGAPSFSVRGIDSDDSDAVKMADQDIYRMPGMSTLQSLVPNLNYAAYLDLIQAQIAEIEVDLPEVRYYKLMEPGSISGVALQLMMGPAIGRALEARGIAEHALERAHAMALTIGQKAGIWSGLGEFDNGDFEHSFTERGVLPQTELDMATTTNAYVSAGIPLNIALVRAGWSPAEAVKATLATDENPALTNEAIDVAAQKLSGQLDGVLTTISQAVTDKLVTSGAVKRIVAEKAGGNGSE